VDGDEADSSKSSDIGSNAADSHDEELADSGNVQSAGSTSETLEDQAAVISNDSVGPRTTLARHINDPKLQVPSQDVQSSRADPPSYKRTDTPVARPLRSKHGFPGRSRMIFDVKKFLTNELGGSSSFSPVILYLIQVFFRISKCSARDKTRCTCSALDHTSIHTEEKPSRTRQLASRGADSRRGGKRS
jgi:hypothetical protein